MEELKQRLKFKRSQTHPTGPPRDFMVMESILRNAGCKDYEPAIINQMLQFTYRYVSTILRDAKEFAQYCDRDDGVILEDVRLAMKVMEDKIAKPITREVLFELTKQRNSKDLPLISDDSRFRLPHGGHCLLAPNYIKRRRFFHNLNELKRRIKM